MAELAIEWHGRMRYADALDLQLERVAGRRSGDVGDCLLLLEHPPVITLGRSARRTNLLARPGELRSRGIEVHEVARGGDITFHAPGQLVGYLVVDLAARGAKDVHRFLRRIESTLCEALRELGLTAEARPGVTGVFVADCGRGERSRKLASIGVGLKGWVSWHGFALNVDVDLSGFDAIVACGLRDVEMTSVARELSRPPEDLGRLARDAVAGAFAKSW